MPNGMFDPSTGMQDPQQQPMTPLEQTLVNKPQPPTPISPDPAINNALTMLHGVNIDIDPKIINIIKAVNEAAARGANGAVMAAYVKPGDNHINVDNWTDEYKNAAKGNRDAVVDLAGTLAHEHYHLLNGPDEPSAYDEQLRVLQLLHARNKAIKNIQKSKAYVIQQVKDKAAGGGS